MVFDWCNISDRIVVSTHLAYRITQTGGDVYRSGYRKGIHIEIYLGRKSQNEETGMCGLTGRLSEARFGRQPGTRP